MGRKQAAFVDVRKTPALTFSLWSESSRCLINFILLYLAVTCPTANSIAQITRHMIPTRNRYIPIVGAGDGTGRTQRNIPIMMNTIARIRRGCISFYYFTSSFIAGGAVTVVVGGGGVAVVASFFCTCSSIALAVILEPLLLSLSIPAAVPNVSNPFIRNCACVSSSGGVAVLRPIPRTIPANAPVISALPCFLTSNFSPLALNAIHDDRKPPAIPAIT